MIQTDNGVCQHHRIQERRFRFRRAYLKSNMMVVPFQMVICFLCFFLL